MKKSLQLTLLFSLFTVFGFSQTDKFWKAHGGNIDKIITDKAAARSSFPKIFKLFDLNLQSIKQELFSKVINSSSHSTVITLPNASGTLEQFEVYEASNFEPALQSQFPQIRAFSGKGITDKYATLKLSISPQGIQTMIFRAEKEAEFIEPYSTDHTIYAAFKSQRKKGQFGWTCSTDDQNMLNDLNHKLHGTDVSNSTASSTGELKTMRLAQSVTAEYANFFGASTAGTPADQALVLAAVNNTITRCNGVYEKDLALHLNLVANTTAVFYYNTATDPYATVTNAFSPPASWNSSLQSTLTSIIGEANYDVGHLFGASGGGGNAGCIGCVCVNGQKGSGITSPATGTVNPSTTFPPSGDDFDIDYVVHEIGHQLGATHTFTFSSEGGPVATSSQREVGSGITIMAYAGITSQDVAPHSIPYYHAISIAQIQSNLATKTCPITTSITANNATPVVAAVPNYTIPLSTPFALTGSATDANPGDALTYQWEQNDATTTLNAASSIASPTKATGPNFLSFSPTISGTRTFPILATILAGNYVTGPLPGGDAGINIEALSSVARTLNFRLTVRDNSPYVSTGLIKVGQTAFTDMTVTVDGASGPFQVTVPNTAVSYSGGSIQTVTWDVNNTTAAPISCANVKISYSTDGGLTFPTVLAASTANDGTEALTIPVGATTTARIKIEAVGNIFFDISNTNFTVSVPPNEFTFNATTPTTAGCPAGAPTVTMGTTVTGTFTTPIALTATGVPAGTTLTFAPNPLTPGSSTVATLNNASTLAAGTYNITVTGTAGAVVKTTTITYIIPAGAVITSQPADRTVCNGSTAAFTVAASGSGLTYQWQESTALAGPYVNVSTGTGGTTATFTTVVTTSAMNNTYYRVIVTNICGATTSSVAKLTVNTVAAIGTQPTAQTAVIGCTATFSVAATGTGLLYQWQVSTNNGTTFADISGATATSYTTPVTTNAFNNNQYRVNILSTCSPVTQLTSSAAVLTVSIPVVVTQAPIAQSGCAGDNYTFSVAATAPVGATLAYQWQVSYDGGTIFTNVIPGTPPSPSTNGTAATYTVNAAPLSASGYLYRVVVSINGQPCGAVTTSAVALRLSNKPAVELTYPLTSTTNPAVNRMIFATVSPANANISYSWKRNGVVIPNTLMATSFVLAVDDNASYQVTITDLSTGCQSISNTIATTARTSDNLLLNRVFIYPNPVRTTMQVRFNNSTSADRGTMLNIYDSKGIRVFTKAYVVNGTFGRMDVDMSTFQNGTYLVYVMDKAGNKLGGGKVVKLN